MQESNKIQLIKTYNAFQALSLIIGVSSIPACASGHEVFGLGLFYIGIFFSSGCQYNKNIDIHLQNIKTWFVSRFLLLSALGFFISMYHTYGIGGN